MSNLPKFSEGGSVASESRAANWITNELSLQPPEYLYCAIFYKKRQCIATRVRSDLHDVVGSDGVF
jgi:hypothetical protein